MSFPATRHRGLRPLCGRPLLSVATLAMALLAGCSSNPGTQLAPADAGGAHDAASAATSTIRTTDTGTGSQIGSAAVSTSVTGTNSTVNTGTGSRSQIGTGSGTGSGVATRTGSGTGTGSHSQIGTGSGTGTGSGSSTASHSQVVTGSGTGTGVSTGTGAAASTDTGLSIGTASCPGTGALAPGGGGTSYHVGSGQAYTTIGAVPWYSLKAGDTVYVHYQSTPYHEKFLISGQGTASQWIRVVGVPGPNCELPVISGDGATTSANMHNHWQDATGNNAIQELGIVQIAVNTSNLLPSYIQIAGLEIRDSGSAYSFTAENGTKAKYDTFSACIYARTVSHVRISGNTLHNCGLGFYNWIGDGSEPNTYWSGLEVDTVLQGNYFYDNGAVGSYTCHQSYTESQGVTIEYNHYGPMKTGSLGSQIKDRSAGTVIRYNFIEQSPQGWDIDLVNPQNSWPTLGSLPTYAHDFVYGNLILDRTRGQDIIHWDEDDGMGGGRANQASGLLSFYDNTFVLTADKSDLYGALDLFNETAGGYECSSSAMPGTIDVRNNLFVSLPRTTGASVPLQFGYCGTEKFNFGTNWVSPGWTVWRQGGTTASGTANLVSPAGNNPGFVNAAGNDFRLVAGGSATGIAGALGPAVTSNPGGADYTPTLEYLADRRVESRRSSGAGSDVGAFASGAP